MSSRSVKLLTLFLGTLRHPKHLTSTYLNAHTFRQYRPGSSVSRVYAPGNGRSLVRSQAMTLLLVWHSDLQGRAKTGQPCVRVIRLDVVSCLGHDTSVRQHYKSEQLDIIVI